MVVVFFFPISKSLLNGKQEQNQALSKIKKQDKCSTTPAQKLQHFGHWNSTTGYQEREVQHWLRFTNGNSFCHLLSPATMEIIRCSMQILLISSRCLQRAFSLQLSTSSSKDLTDLCMYLCNAGWSPLWPACACVWRHQAVGPHSKMQHSEPNPPTFCTLHKLPNPSILW